ncbi:hypothetical protein FQA39_LY01708 [Lamprigera yunnana]|nr:hypothetical protein FQA39_LY01708 [Lamprigera yunnana]
MEISLEDSPSGAINSLDISSDGSNISKEPAKEICTEITTSKNIQQTTNVSTAPTMEPTATKAAFTPATLSQDAEKMRHVRISVPVPPQTRSGRIVRLPVRFRLGFREEELTVSIIKAIARLGKRRELVDERSRENDVLICNYSHGKAVEERDRLLPNNCMFLKIEQEDTGEILAKLLDLTLANFE